MMNRTLKPTPVLLHGILITAVLLVISVGINGYQEATSQTGNVTSATGNATSATGNATSATGNATSATNQTSQSLGNLTRGDFSPVQESLAAARDFIFEGNGNLRSYFALNVADDELYRVIDRLELEPEVGDQLRQQIIPVRQSINDAQEAIFNGDLAKALKDVNSASTTLVKITLPLPSGETGEE
jgi:hypothetical protein